MEKWTVVLLLLVTVAAAEVRKAIVHLHQPNTSIKGNVTFEQSKDSDMVTITGTVEGLHPGKHGFHIHEKGDITLCSRAGPHFNPKKLDHGGPESVIRHAGDLGNIIANPNGIADIKQQDKVITLFGAESIVGRSVVVHENEDDLGKNNTTDSKTTGSAGGRLVCGVIGIL